MTELSEYQHDKHIQSKQERAKMIIADMYRVDFNKRLQAALKNWMNVPNASESTSKKGSSCIRSRCENF